jgi:hypothetical protein
VLRLRNRIVGIVLTAVGAVFLIVGVFMMISSGWTTTTATAGSCLLHGQTTGSSHTTQVYTDYCQMTWVDAGVTHTGMLDTGKTNVHPGQTFTVKVSGDSIAMPAPLWYRLVTLGVGVVAVAGGLTLALRRTRSEPLTMTRFVP